jgi:hypothetical protein
MVLTTVNLKRFLRIKHFLAYVARNLLSFLMCHADMKREIVSSKIFFGTRRNGTFKVFNLCMSLQELKIIIHLILVLRQFFSYLFNMLIQFTFKLISLAAKTHIPVRERERQIKLFESSYNFINSRINSQMPLQVTLQIILVDKFCLTHIA